jgi:predicted transposase/invertase (TIGR01784 family)
VIDKFPNLTLEELEVMLDLESLRKSKVYQEGKQEGKQEGISEGVLKQKLETIPILQELGLTSEQIAERLKLDVETVRENVKQ